MADVSGTATATPPEEPEPLEEPPDADEAPKKTFITAHPISPIAMKKRGLAWSPRNPLRNLEIP